MAEKWKKNQAIQTFPFKLSKSASMYAGIGIIFYTWLDFHLTSAYMFGNGVRITSAYYF